MCWVHLDQELFVSCSLNLAVFVGGSSDFFEIALKIAVFGFVAVGAFDVVDDDDISDVFVDAVGLNLLFVLVVLL